MSTLTAFMFAGCAVASEDVAAAGRVGGTEGKDVPHTKATRSGLNVAPANRAGTGGYAGNQGGDMVSPHEPQVDFETLYADMGFYDDVKSCRLDLDKVISAKRLEMEYFKNMWSTPRFQGRRPDGLEPR